LDLFRVNEQIHAFAEYLERAWDSMLKLIGHGRGEMLGDRQDRYNWIQANWEVLVEANLWRARDIPIVLEPYGEGADFDGRASRITFPERSPSHAIVVKATGAVDVLTGTTLGQNNYQFEEFVRWNGKQYEALPPFGYTKLVQERSTEAPIVVAKDDVTYWCKRIAERDNTLQ
jgi:hypothetical protein